MGVGANRGLGAQLAHRFSAMGLKVYLAGRTQKKLDIVVDEIKQNGGEATAVVCDATNETQVIELFKLAGGNIDLAIYNAGNLKQGSKIAMITSQGGSVGWRDTQCPNGGDYGHHMSKSAANMAGKLVANELKDKGITTIILHPGFIRTDMTRKYAEIWDIEGAVTSDIACKRVLHEINILTKENNGKFINCEDGLEIPW